MASKGYPRYRCCLSGTIASGFGAATTELELQSSAQQQKILPIDGERVVADASIRRAGRRRACSTHACSPIICQARHHDGHSRVCVGSLCQSAWLKTQSKFWVAVDVAVARSLRSGFSLPQALVRTPDTGVSLPGEIHDDPRGSSGVIVGATALYIPLGPLLGLILYQLCTTALYWHVRQKDNYIS